MARYTGPKDRLSRREGFDLFGKGAKLTRLNVLPGVHGPKGITKAVSQYSKQLREKQKVRRFYGVLEKQFRKYIEKAINSKGNTADSLFGLLETRLDNVVYRLGFAKSRFHARQMVSHRHVLVNGKRLNIPSYQLKVGETVSLSPKMSQVDEERTVPQWLERQATVGKVLRVPMRQDVIEPFSEHDIVEYYSR